MNGIKAIAIHGGHTQSKRSSAIELLKKQHINVLVATDVASRGIDVTGIELVINFDLPTNSEDYVHRIGRTARAGAGGHAISFVTPDQKNELRAIERLVRKNLPVSQLPELPPARALKFVPRDSQGFSHSYKRPSSGGYTRNKPFQRGPRSSNRSGSSRFRR